MCLILCKLKAFSGKSAFNPLNYQDAQLNLRRQKVHKLHAVESTYTFTISPANAGTDDTPPSLSLSYTSTEYTPVPRGPLEGEEGHKDMLTDVSSDLTTTLQYVTPVCVSVRYTKHPVASEPGLKRHTSPVGDEMLTETPTTSNVPTKEGCVHDQMDNSALYLE